MENDRSFSRLYVACAAGFRRHGQQADLDAGNRRALEGLSSDREGSRLQDDKKGEAVMTPVVLFVLHLLLLGASAFALFWLMRRFGQKPALWLIPGIYCSLMLVYFVGFHFLGQLLRPFGYQPLMLDYTLTEFVFWGAVFLLLLILSGRGSSKALIALAFAGGVPSPFCVLPLASLYLAAKDFLCLNLGNPFIFLAAVGGAIPFCLCLLITLVCRKLHKPFQASALALLAAAYLGALAGLFVGFYVIGPSSG